MTTDNNSNETCNIATALTGQARQQGNSAAIHYPARKRDNYVLYRSATYAELDEMSDD